MKFQTLCLLFGELLTEPMQQVSGGNLVDERRLLPATNLFLVKLLGVVVLPVRQVLPAVDRPMVGDLDDPGGCGAFARVKEVCFLKKQKENVLTEVLCFGRISENPPRNT
jgi:hypothetical protein